MNPERGHTQRQMNHIEHDIFQQSIYRDYETLLLKKDCEINDAMAARRQLESQAEELKVPMR